MNIRSPFLFYLCCPHLVLLNDRCADETKEYYTSPIFYIEYELFLTGQNTVKIKIAFYLDSPCLKEAAGLC